MKVTGLEPRSPGCLAGFRLSPAEGPLAEALLADLTLGEASSRRWAEEMGREFVPVMEQQLSWSLECACGGSAGKLLGFREGDLYTAPVHFECETCKTRVLVFDEALHGWNAETGRRRKKKPGVGTRAWHCRQCKQTRCRAGVLLTYQGDHYEEGKAKERWQDLFDVIVIAAECAGCGLAATVYDAECA